MGSRKKSLVKESGNDRGGLGHSVNIDAKFEVRTSDGGVYEVHASPTTTVSIHLANELFASSPSAILKAITRIYLADDTGVNRDYADISPSDWYSVTTGTNYAEAVVTKDIPITADYGVGRFRAYGGSDMYFNAVPPGGGFPVATGQTVTVTLTLRVSISHSPSVGGGLPSVSVNSTRLAELILKIFMGQRPSGSYLTLKQVRYMAGTANLLTASLTRSYSTGATSGSASHDFANFTSSGNLTDVRVDSEGYADSIVYTLSTPLSVTTSDRIRYSINISA